MTAASTMRWSAERLRVDCTNILPPREPGNKGPVRNCSLQSPSRTRFHTAIGPISEIKMKNAITISKEDYLKAVLEAESEGQTVISSTLAHWLSVSPPAVTMALKRLKRDGYVEVKTDGIVRLTPKGKETAYRTARRHHLIERMLSEMFGMDWYRVHDEAERLEHAVSPAFEAKLIEKL